MDKNKEQIKETKKTRVSITPSGFFGSSPDNIVHLDNFMTAQELSYLNNFARNNEIWDVTESRYNENGVCIYDASYWENRVATDNSLNSSDPLVADVIRGMQARLKIEVDKFFKVDAIPTSAAVVRWLPGQFQHPHADKELHIGENRGKPNDFPYYDVAGLFYLNDDYEGGELYFPEQGIQFKPKAGSAYFFPGDMNYIHGVTEIVSGIRYVCPFFWTILEHKKATHK